MSDDYDVYGVLYLGEVWYCYLSWTVLATIKANHPNFNVTIFEVKEGEPYNFTQVQSKHLQQY